MLRWSGAGRGRPSAPPPPQEDADFSGGPTTINLRFPGQYYDAETGLHYNWHRYYDPRVGRYITSDRVGVGGGINTYAYAHDNPLSRVDPSGLVAWKGKFDIKTFSIWTGGAAASFELTSDCVDGVRAKVNVHARAIVVVDIGVLPVSQVKGSIELEDNKLNLDPYGFNGRFEFATVGPVVGPLDFFTRVTLGDAFSRSIDARGLDLSFFSGAHGNATLAGPVQYEQCICKLQ